MTDPTGMQWYRAQRDADVANAKDAERLLRLETEAFAEAMSGIADCLDDVVTTGVHDAATQWQVALAIHGFNLLLSDWEANLSGRPESVSTHTRQLVDTCQFVLALDAKPQLADQMDTGTVKVEMARRAVRDAIKDHQPGPAKDWYERVQQGSSTIQNSAHVGPFTIKMGWSVRSENGARVAILRPGGHLSQESARRSARLIAVTAFELLRAVSYAFRNQPPIAKRLEALAQRADARCSELLVDQDGGSLPRGPLDRLRFVSAYSLGENEPESIEESRS